MLVTVVGMCFTWPTLEGLVSEGEDGCRVCNGMSGSTMSSGPGRARWRISAAGAMLDRLGLNSMFYFRCAVLRATGFDLLAGRFGCTTIRPLARLDRPFLPLQHRHGASAVRRQWPGPFCAWPGWRIPLPTSPSTRWSPSCRAWRSDLGLSTTQAGFCCSVWCFARLAAFVGLWFWPGWHYRFRWLLAAYLALVGHVCRDSPGAAAGGHGRRRDGFRPGAWTDLLLIALLFDGCG